MLILLVLLLLLVLYHLLDLECLHSYSCNAILCYTMNVCCRHATVLLITVRVIHVCMFGYWSHVCDFSYVLLVGVDGCRWECVASARCSVVHTSRLLTNHYVSLLSGP